MKQIIFSTLFLIILSLCTFAQNNDIALKKEDDTLCKSHIETFYNYEIESICDLYNKNLILVLNDDFIRDSLDESLWQTCFPWNCCYDKRFFYFTKKNVKIENGILKLTAKEDPGYYDVMVYDENGNFHIEQKYFKYTSGMIYSKQQFSYGIYEIRCRWPEVTGLWPTFWLHGGDGYNEIDIFDNGGNTKTYISNIFHYSEYWDDTMICSYKTTFSPGFFTQWHTYTCYYYPDKIIIKIDNETNNIFYYLINIIGQEGINCNFTEGNYLLNDAYPSGPMNLISSLQVSEWVHDDFTPTTMEIDYIKVWQIDKNCCIPYKLYEATNNLPTKTHVKNYINAGNDVGIPNISGDVIVLSNQYVNFKAGESIDLLPGFTAEAGSDFTAEIQDCNQMTNPEGDDIIIVNIPDEFSPDGDGINDKLCIEVNGATKYDISVCDYNWPHDQYYIRTNIPIRTNHFCVWDGKCDYDDINCLLYHKCNRKRNIGLKFYNCDTNIYVTKTIYVECSNNKSENDSCSNYNINTLNSNYLSNILKFDINPNPTFDNTMISFNLYESDNIYLYIANLSGNIIKEIINQKFDKGLHNINIDISDLATGTYLCILETSNEIKKIKFIKM